MASLLETGKILNTHGIRGELKIEPWADSAQFVMALTEVYIDNKKYSVEGSRIHKGLVLMKLLGIDSIDDAIPYKNKIIFLDRDLIELPEEAFFVADIVGYTVYDERLSRVTGHLKEIFTTPAGDIFVIAGDEGEYMVPAVDEFISRRDEASRTLYIRTIKGMSPNED